MSEKKDLKARDGQEVYRVQLKEWMSQRGKFSKNSAAVGSVGCLPSYHVEENNIC